MKLLAACMFVVFGACILPGCSGNDSEQEPAPIADVQVQPAARHPIEEKLLTYGVVEFAPSHTRAVIVQVESQLAEQLVLPGAQVKSGQPLVKLTPSATSSLDVDKAARDASVAEAEYQRVQRLRDQGLATDSDLRNANAAAQTARQMHDSLLSRIGTHGTTLRAPIDGVIDAFTAQPGDLIAPGTVLMRIVDPQAVHVRLGLEPDDVIRIKSGQAVTLTTLSANSRTVDGHVTAVDSRVDTVTRLAGALVEAESSTGLIPGTSVRARIVIATHANAVTVPRAAVLYADEQAFVFVAQDGKAHRRPVTAGITDDTQIEIVEGLRAGESVITGGNYELEDGMAIKLPGAQAAKSAGADAS
jgi:RND family efflux transporter MFP subunit